MYYVCWRDIKTIAWKTLDFKLAEIMELSFKILITDWKAFFNRLVHVTCSATFFSVFTEKCPKSKYQNIYSCGCEYDLYLSILLTSYFILFISLYYSYYTLYHIGIDNSCVFHRIDLQTHMHSRQWSGNIRNYGHRNNAGNCILRVFHHTICVCQVKSHLKEATNVSQLSWCV